MTDDDNRRSAQGKGTTGKLTKAERAHMREKGLTVAGMPDQLKRMRHMVKECEKAGLVVGLWDVCAECANVCRKLGLLEE